MVSTPRWRPLRLGARAAVLDTLEEAPTRFARLQEKLRNHFDFNLGDVSFQKEQDLTIHADYSERSGRRTVNLDLSTAGSGFLQVMQILTPIYRYADSTSVVLLDEPDAHLHPNLQRTIAKVLRETAHEEKLQIVASTHSTSIISVSDPASIIPVSANKAVLNPLGNLSEVDHEVQERLDSFTTAKVSIAGKLLFVEDRNTKILEKVDEVLGTCIFEGPSAVPVLLAEGRDDKVPFRIKPTIEAIVGVEVDVFFIRDGDSLPDDWRERLENYARERDVTLLLLPYHEIESILLNAQLIRRAAESLGVSVDEGGLKEMLRESMKDVVTMSRFDFDRTLRDSVHKTSLLLGDDYSFQKSESVAKQIRSTYECLQGLDELKKIVPAKEALKEFRKRFEQTHKVDLTIGRLIRFLQSEDIPTSVADLLSRIHGVG